MEKLKCMGTAVTEHTDAQKKVRTTGKLQLSLNVLCAHLVHINISITYRILSFYSLLYVEWDLGLKPRDVQWMRFLENKVLQQEQEGGKYYIMRSFIIYCNVGENFSYVLLIFVIDMIYCVHITLLWAIHYGYTFRHVS